MIEIDGRRIGPSEPPYIIAEVGINARNELTLAKRFIEMAAKSGADAVKFQTHIAQAEMVEEEMRRIDSGDVYDTVEACEWSFEEHEELQSHAESNDITFLSTPFSTEAVDVLKELNVPAIKMGSGEMNNRHLTEYAARTGQPLLVSTGMNTLKDIKDACKFLDKKDASYALFYCVSEYPTTADDFEFNTISTLKRIADVPVGFSDHSQGVEAAKVAIGHGAQIVEKHFTIDRRLPGPDQAVSVEPDELADLCEFASLYHVTSANRSGLRQEEIEISEWAQHSLVADEDIDEGEPLTEENTTTKRPGTGLSAERYFEVLGRHTTRSISAGDVIRVEDIRDD